jgi:hypothetical protein
MTDENGGELTDEDKEFLKGLREALESGTTRRAALATLLGGGAYAAGLSAGTAKAGTNQVGTIGTDSSRVDIEAEDLDMTDQSSVPSEPESGQVRMYFRSGNPYYKTNGGSETPFSSPFTNVASGQTTLSSGSAVVTTGITATDATFFLGLGLDDPDADAKVAARLFWDDSAGEYKIEFVEDGTSVGNPTVNYDILRVR